MHGVLAAVKKNVSNEMNNILMEKFTMAEIERAIQQMHPTKAPALDGMPCHSFRDIGVW